MPVNNSITQSAQRNNLPEKTVTYQVNGAEITLSPSIVRNYLTNGNTQITNDEVEYFMNICKYQKLNPLIKDAFLVKYGSQPAAIIVAKDALLKRAKRNPRYRGHEAGVIVLRDGKIEQRTGAFYTNEDYLVGGWAKVYVDGYNVPIESAVSFREYAQTTRDGSLNSMWGGKPGTMIRKVALSTALREAFPEDLGDLYEAEEIVANINDMPEIPADPETPTAPQPQQTEPEDYTQIPTNFGEPPVDEFPEDF